MAKSKLVRVNKEITKNVVSGYQKIEDTVVGGYKKIEETVVGGYEKIEDAFVDQFLTREGESAEDAQIRLRTERK